VVVKKLDFFMTNLSTLYEALHDSMAVVHEVLFDLVNSNLT